METMQKTASADFKKFFFVCNIAACLRTGTAGRLRIPEGRLRMAGICIPADHVLVPQR